MTTTVRITEGTTPANNMSDVLMATLAQVAQQVENQQLDEGLAGYLAGYLDRVRQEAN